MKNDITVVRAKEKDADIVSQLVYALLFELFEDNADEFPLSKMRRGAEQLLKPDTGFWSFLAIHEGNVVGIMNLNECAAIYAGGNFGEITELYVKPDFRSLSVGKQLIASASTFAAQRSWGLIEVGTGDMPRCKRTFDFYVGNGFTEVGPRLELVF